MKAIVISAIAVTLSVAPAVAGGHKQAEAKAMSSALKSGINQDQATKDFVSGLGLGNGKSNEKAAVPAKVSGGGNGGWGNIGSTLTGPEGSVSGR